MSKPFGLFIGRLEYKKNIKGIIEAFNLFKKKYKTSHKLVLVGNQGYGWEEALRLIKKYQLGNDIQEIGWVNQADLSLILANTDFFLFPSFYEGFGLPILEAFAHKVPVITSNCASMPEIAGDSALLVSPDKYHQIAEAIHKITSDNKVRADLINQAHERVKIFSWERCAKKTIAILKQINP